MHSMQTASTLLPLLLAGAVFFGILTKHYVSTFNTDSLPWTAIGLFILTLGGAMVVAANAANYPEWQTFLHFVTYSLAGCAGGVGSYFSSKLFSR